MSKCLLICKLFLLIYGISTSFGCVEIKFNKYSRGEQVYCKVTRHVKHTHARFVLFLLGFLYWYEWMMDVFCHGKWPRWLSKGFAPVTLSVVPATWLDLPNPRFIYTPNNPGDYHSTNVQKSNQSFFFSPL